MLSAPKFTGLVIVGAGPAGLAPLFAAASTGTLRQVLRAGVTILERGNKPGAGALTEYAIRSDSGAATFLDIVLCSTEPALLRLRSHPTTEALRQLGEAAAPLQLVSSFLHLAGDALCKLVAGSERGRVCLGVEVLSVTRTTDQNWRIRYRKVGSNSEQEIVSSAVILALGAHQPERRLATEPVAGLPLLPRYSSKLMQSGSVLAQGGLLRVARMLQGVREPRVVVVGGSTSAGAVATQLLGAGSPLRFGQGALTLLHRKTLPIFYPSVGEAYAEDYREFAPKDVCRLTGRVYRLSGFRLDSRELIMSARGIGNRPPEPRMRLLQLTPDAEKHARGLLAQADLIVAALGYRPRTLPVFDATGEVVPLHTPTSRQWSLVDSKSRLLTRDSVPLHGLYAIGLAAGPKADEARGGETGFEGQVNSLWMWQNSIGMRIIDQILGEDMRPRPHVDCDLQDLDLRLPEVKPSQRALVPVPVPVPAGSAV